MSVGRVHLVGAGPGDPGLITVRGLEVLRRADVAILDRLVNRAILGEAPSGALRIDAGKRSGHHRLDQDRINDRLVHHARRGCRLVRLKGGDPFVFGRGGEEAKRLAEVGIPFEVVQQSRRRSPRPPPRAVRSRIDPGRPPSRSSPATTA
jgi:siroheme synthase